MKPKRKLSNSLTFWEIHLKFFAESQERKSVPLDFCKVNMKQWPGDG